jgi:hypothetical protein
MTRSLWMRDPFRGEKHAARIRFVQILPAFSRRGPGPTQPLAELVPGLSFTLGPGVSLPIANLVAETPVPLRRRTYR